MIYPLKSQNLYPDDYVIKVELIFPQNDFWELMKENYEEEIEIPAKLIVNDTLTLDSVGVRFKGNSSYRISSEKKPFNISIDEFKKDQRLWGYKSLNLNNGFADPTYVREKIANDIFRNYLPSMEVGYVNLFLNGENWGLYLNVEQVNKDFYQKWFFDNSGNAYKGDPIGDLRWQGNEPDPYKLKYEKKTNEDEDDWTDLITLCHILFNNDSLALELPPILNIDRTLWYIALCNIFVNLDSYIHSNHNYYLYRSPFNGQFNIIPWDMNESFGCFPPALTIKERETYPVFNINTPKPPPMLVSLFDVQKYRDIYLAHYRTILKEFFHPDTLIKIINKWQNLVDKYVQEDNQSPYTYQQFKENVNKNVRIENRDIPGIISLVTNRRNFLSKLPDFNKTIPNISEVKYNPTEPKAQDIVSFSAKISDAKGILKTELYYKFDNELFKSIEMYDDGLHSDGKPNDGIYGCSLEIEPSHSSKTLNFYILTQNIDSVLKFEPERAEFVLYSVQIQTNESSATIVINEFMADNKSTITDAQGKFEDWIELYNYGDEFINLEGMHLTDNQSKPTKWVFPDTTIQAKEYMLIWADEDTLDKPGLHSNFKLSKDGEYIGIYESLENGVQLVDEVAFGTQDNDISEGRYPNGYGDYIKMTPTPNAENLNFNSVENINPTTTFDCIIANNFPNPFINITTINYSLCLDGLVEITLYNLIGLEIKTFFSEVKKKGDHHISFSGKDLAPCLYFYKVSLNNEFIINKMFLLK